MNGSINLRTLTYKSKIKFGKYPDYTVYELISLLGNRGHILLIYYYFLFDKINFTEDILDELCITKEFRIPKPSKITKDKFDIIVKEIVKERNIQFRKLDEETKSKKKGMDRKIGNLLEGMLNSNININGSTCKLKMQSINQGHTK